MIKDEKITLPCLKEILEDVYKITQDNELPLCFRGRKREINYNF